MKELKTINRYIPMLVYSRIQELDFNNNEQLYVICDMIHRITIYRKENTDYTNSYRDIPTIYYTNIIKDKRNYKKAMDFLKDNYIIECDGIYSKQGGKALGYRFKDEYLSKLIEVKISKPTIFKSITKNINNQKSYVEDNYKEYRNFFINNFNINYEKALDYINQWFDEELSILHSTNLNLPLCSSFLREFQKITNKYNHLFISISSIRDGNLFFNRSKTNGRINTNLTNLKSELKQFITTKNLYQIDIKNSQPYFLSLLLLNYFNSPLCSSFLDEKEVNKFADWTGSGLFYEFFERAYFNNTGKDMSRKDIKELMFCILYSKNGSYKNEKKIFGDIFPTILKFIEKEKETKHNSFSIKLQNIESKMCIDKICKKLDENNINYYTIHDAWLIDESDVDEVEKIIITTFYDNVYRRPELSIEKIN